MHALKMALLVACLTATATVYAQNPYAGAQSAPRERVVVRKDAPNGMFGNEIDNLSQLASTRPNGTIRVLVEVELDPSDRSTPRERSLSPHFVAADRKLTHL